MNGIIIAAIVFGAFIILALIGYLAYRSSRPINQVAPRRRELHQMQERYTSAHRAIAEIEVVVDEYRGQLDIVGDRMSSQVIQIIRQHTQRILENDR